MPAATPHRIDLDIAALAERQHGVLSHAQLAGLGLGKRAIAHRLSAGRLHAIHVGVYAVGHPVLTADGKRMAAVLACGAGAVLSHQSAAELHALLTFDGSRHHVTVPDRSARRRAGITVHRPRRLPEDEVTAVRGIPVTTVERTLLDLADVASRTRLERACDEAERRAVVDWATALLLIDRHRGRRTARRLHRVLVEHGIASDRTRSRPERNFLALCRAHGLPAPDVNVQVLGHMVDFSWPDHGLIVEIDPPEFHRTVFRMEADKRRDAALTVAGWRVVRITDARMAAEPDVVIAQLRVLLRHTGAFSSNPHAHVT